MTQPLFKLEIKGKNPNTFCDLTPFSLAEKIQQMKNNNTFKRAIATDSNGNVFLNNGQWA